MSKKSTGSGSSKIPKVKVLRRYTTEFIFRSGPSGPRYVEYKFYTQTRPTTKVCQLSYNRNEVEAVI